MLITLQYLEDSPELISLSKRVVIEKLKYAFDKLPITHLLIGWHIPDRLLEACKKECEKNKVRFVRWQPLLTGDGVFTPREEWQVTSMSGGKVAGFQNMPEFTFVCPNHVDSTNVIFDHIDQLTNLGIYDGFFLDRIRYPSPATNLSTHLGCFCNSCQRKAQIGGVDLGKLQKSLQNLTNSANGKIELIKCLFGNNKAITDESLREMVTNWMKFRESSISDFVKGVSQIIKHRGLDVGLDCFSPGLTHMVGQDLKILSRYANWIKLMSYAHTLGPAGLPFEIIDFIDYLLKFTPLTERAALKLLSSFLDIPLPDSIKKLQKQGLSSHALELEIRKGKDGACIPVLAGLELVEIPGVASFSNDQLILDHKVVRETGIAGLSISWDLWHIPNNRLDLISSIWLE
ncbi:MAG: hypothetical protein NTZ74_00615 [Chloroflexi bacterium]|nr:hypothetical protein [Chloroflexota bacterium]